MIIYDSGWTGPAGLEGRRPRKIAYLTRKWPPAVGGMETYSIKLVDELAKSHIVRTIALPGRPDGSPPGWFALLSFPILVFLRILLSPGRADIVHIGDMALWPLACLARLFWWRSHVFLSAHGTDVGYPRRRGWKAWLYGTYLRGGAVIFPKAMVIANSEATAIAVREAGYRRIENVALATDVKGPAATGRHEGHLFFAGRLVKRKGCGWFIRNVLPLLPDGIDLTVAGTRWDDDESAALESGRVNFVGSLHGPELQQAYASALAVVVPNIRMTNGEFEGFGLIATEAGAAGGVALVSACDGLTEAVIDKKTGILVAPGDAEAWVHAINDVAGWTSVRRKEFVDSAQKTIRSHYSWARVAQDVVAVYDGAAEGQT